jgi:hypothetical protein
MWEPVRKSVKRKENRVKRRAPRSRAAALLRRLLWILVLLPAVRERLEAEGQAPAAQPAPPKGGEEIRKFLEAERRPYREALSRARGWLDGLRVDPIELRAHGIKGKKKLVELLDAYYRLLQIAPAAEKESLRKRIREVVEVTYQDRYHDMLSVSDECFKQDATSYLRAALLMERLGLDTRRYRAEIARAAPRLDAHLRQRGPNQRRIFHWYYQHFGLKEPFPLQNALEEGLIARRADPRRLSRSDVYDFTHEVFGPYEYGERLDADPFSDGDKVYLRQALPVLTDRALKGQDPDLTAELVSCIRYLRFLDLPVYREGILFLLRSQSADGSWGHYGEERKLLGDYVRQGFVLHTTLVALDALTIAFEDL